MLATRLAHVVQVIADLAIGIDPPADFPAFGNQGAHALIVRCAAAHRLLFPCVVAIRMNRQRRAETTYRLPGYVGIDEGVLHPDCLAKYAAAIFWMSRSSVARRNSPFRRRISSAWLGRVLNQASQTKAQAR